MSEVLYTVTDEDGEVMEITEEVLERQRAASDLMIQLTGIARGTLHDPGIVTLTRAPELVPGRGNFIVVAWKIDDAAWKVRTSGMWKISDDDAEARPGLTSFYPNTMSWSFGIAPLYDLAEAVSLRDRIVRLTAEFGLDIESIEYEYRKP